MRSKKQKLLEENHEYKWIDGEVKYIHDLKNKIYLSSDEKLKIKNMSKIELFELFFSAEIKDIIIEASINNNLELTHDKLDSFIGILIVSIFSSRKSIEDYWSKKDILSLSKVSSCMSRNDYRKIKSRLKFAKITEKNLKDRLWRVRKLVDTFKINLHQFGYFSSNMSIDESMVKFYGRTILKQYMPKKPIRFGIKIWALCTITGYLLDFEIYCGKQSENEEKLSNCCLGSKVVMKMLHNFLTTIPSENLDDYHVTFDNFLQA